MFSLTDFCSIPSKNGLHPTSASQRCEIAPGRHTIITTFPSSQRSVREDCSAAKWETDKEEKDHRKEKHPQSLLQWEFQLWRPLWADTGRLCLHIIYQVEPRPQVLILGGNWHHVTLYFPTESASRHHSVWLRQTRKQRPHRKDLYGLWSHRSRPAALVRYAG